MLATRTRWPACSLCTVTLPVSTPSYHSSASNNRPLSRKPATPPSRSRFAPLPSKSRPWQHKSPVATPSSITAAAVLDKLRHHLKTVWVRGDASVQAIALDLGLDRKRFKTLAIVFANDALRTLGEPTAESKASLLWDVERLRVEYVDEGAPSLPKATLRAFVAWAASLPHPPPTSTSIGASDPTLSTLRLLSRATDRRYTSEVFPPARSQRRKLILHVGPTNSGKTHSALVALARSRTGVYAGPLRLLAHEVFSRFNEGKIGDEGKRVCNLITGEEQRILDPEAGLSSCTVEMFPMNKRLQVGVIDEIQMIGDQSRGTAWTQAIIGSKCDELHLCGEESVVELVQSIARELGDECVVKRYSRLSPLVVADRSLGGDLSRVRRGDCVVTFSRSNIFAFKRAIEEKTGLRVAVAYGGLPPEVREEQARVFNEGGYDVLVASDAVGMGLNLKIKRIVFESLHKWNGSSEIQLPTPQIKQIAGRAGRYGVHSSPSAPDDAATSTGTVGEATTLDEVDMDILRQAMASPTVQVDQASLAASLDTFQQVEALLPLGTPFSKIFSLVETLAQTTLHYRASGQAGAGLISDAIASIGPLTFAERYLFASAPVNLRDPKVVGALVSFVQSYARGDAIIVVDWAQQAGITRALHQVEGGQSLTNPSTSDLSSPITLSGNPSKLLVDLESFHRSLTLYLWLSYRQPSIFCDRESARTFRRRVERAIDRTLGSMKFERVQRRGKRNSSRSIAPGVGYDAASSHGGHVGAVA